MKISKSSATHMMARILLSLLLIAASLWPAPSQAEVRPNLKCEAAFGTPMTFKGNISGKALSTEMSLTVTCSERFGTYADVYVCVDIGAGNGGLLGANRQLVNGASKLDFQLYSDAARTSVWGDMSGQPGMSYGPVKVTKPFWGNGSFSPAVYGSILSNQQDLNRGTYKSDFTGYAKIRWTVSPWNNVDCSQTLVDESSSSTYFSVEYTVPEHCDVSASTLDFGTQGPLNKKIDAQGSIGVTCTKGTPYSVALGNGLSGTTPQTREMTGPGVDKIAYELYRDPARSLTWGSTSTGAATDNVAGGKTGTGAEEKIPVYGRIPAQDSVTTGDYSDSVVVTVTY